MKTYRPLIFIAAIFIFMISSCEKDPIEERFGQDEMIVNNNLSQLSKRVRKAQDDHILPIYPVAEVSSSMTKSLKSAGVSSNYVLKLRAEVSPPVHEGSTLQASHIKIVGDYAFVTYNMQGPVYLGGLDIFDVSDISNPQLINNVVFTSRDISSVDVEPLGNAGLNHFVYLTGGQELGEPDKLGLNSPAVVEKYILNAANEFKHIEDGRRYFDLPSFAGNDVRYRDEMVYVTSGSAGGLSVLTNGMEQARFEEIIKARSVDTDGTRVVVFSADGGFLHVINIETNDNMVIETGGANYPEAKSIVRIKDDYIFVALGDGGVKMYDINTGNEAGYLPRPVEYLDADTPENYVTNGVSVNDNMVLIANGGSGVHISQFNDGGDLVTVGSMMFEYGSSANFIEARDNKVFVATGKGGLKIIEILHYDPEDGNIPVDDIEIEKTVVCEPLYDRLLEMFPDRVSIYVGGHSDLIGDTPGILRLKEKAPVYITFVRYAAGWNNSLGYYTYDINDPPSSVDDLNMNIIFPFAKMHDGELLEIGDRVRIGGPTVEFNENTVIGFFLVAQGWDPGEQKMVEGIHRVYSDKQFNPGSVQRHLLFLEETCNDIVFCFEDQIGPGSDDDFNDLIFVVSNGDDEFGFQTNYAFDIDGLPVK